MIQLCKKRLRDFGAVAVADLFHGKPAGGDVGRLQERQPVRLRLAVDRNALQQHECRRRDSKIGPGHRGIAVAGDAFLSIEEAARRRDFTINAMLFDPATGELLDPWDGRRDLELRRLRGLCKRVHPGLSLPADLLDTLSDPERQRGLA